MQLNIDISDICLLFILVLCISCIIGINIVYIVEKKLNDVMINISRLPSLPSLPSLPKEHMKTISYKEKILDNVDVVTNDVTTNVPVLYMDRIGKTMGNSSDLNNYADIDQIGSIPLNDYFMEPVASNSNSNSNSV
jgi:hypothetical protein